MQSIVRKKGDECFQKNAILDGNWTQILPHLSQMCYQCATPNPQLIGNFTIFFSRVKWQKNNYFFFISDNLVFTNFWRTATFWKRFQFHFSPWRIWRSLTSATTFCVPFRTRWDPNWPIWPIWFWGTTCWPTQTSLKIWPVWRDLWNF